MKSILYVGATLMIGAGIYGFVDYKKTNHSKELVKMYNSKETSESVSNIKHIENTTEKKAPEIKEKAVVKKLIPQKDEIIEGKMINEEPTITKDETVLEKKMSDVSLNEAVSKNDKRTKKINYKLFSRAPLERKYLEKEFKLEQLKLGEPGKIVPKDSL